MMPGGGHPGFLASFGYAFEGLKAACKLERNIKVMFFLAAVAVLAGLLLQISALEWALIVLCIGAVLCAELINSAIEAVVDLVSPDHHPMAKLAKDYACAGVYVMSLCAALAGIFIYVRALMRLIMG